VVATYLPSKVDAGFSSPTFLRLLFRLLGRLVSGCGGATWPVDKDELVVVGDQAIERLLK
jgi:hypothetical protein